MSTPHILLVSALCVLVAAAVIIAWMTSEVKDENEMVARFEKSRKTLEDLRFGEINSRKK